VIPACDMRPGAAGTAADGYRLPLEPAMAHQSADCDQLHDGLDGVSRTREATPELLEVVDLLELDGVKVHGSRIRGSCHDWRRIDNVKAALAAARRSQPIPAPRPSSDLPTGALAS
jgi:hypothetical protein